VVHAVSDADYLLGNTDAEHERLIRQAIRLHPLTERFFREAGIGLGQRVLELGSGVGDVAMLVARIVGPSGEVVAIERDARTISRARARAAEANLHNIDSVPADIAEYSTDLSLDAGVGRYILQFLGQANTTWRHYRISRRVLGPLCLTFCPSAALVSGRFVAP